MARIFREKKSTSGLKVFIYVVVAIACLIIIWHISSSLEDSQSKEAERIGMEAIVRATVQCYSLEGRYPQGLEYLEENYGLTLDRTKFVYHYQSIGENMMPDIKVLPLEE